MSAIFGIINKDGRPVDPEMVQKMKQAMQHRAKDGSRELLAGNAAFGFCHLVVYPNQEHEQLPLEDGDLVFTANAHLHNRAELINKLGFDPKQFATSPDSYLILQAFKKWGKDCVHHLDGEYVYAIWNKLSQEMFISNDHIGYKALYYYDTPHQFIFCSEIKGIESVKVSPNFFDETSLLQYFNLQGTPASTYNCEITALIGAAILELKQGAVNLKKYWVLKPLGKYNYSNQGDWYEAIQHLFCRAVENRLNTEVPVGIQLSGGLDSSAIACILSKILIKKNKPLYAFSSVLGNNNEEFGQDESYFIQIINEHCGNIIQTDVHALGQTPYDHVDDALKTDEVFPFPFHYMDRCILMAAQKANIKIMFTGIGGDHWISAPGKTVIYRLIKNGHLLKALELLMEFSMREKKGLLRVIGREVALQTGIMRKYFEFRSWDFNSYLQPEFKRKLHFRSSVQEKFATIIRRINSGESGRLMQVFDNRHYYYQMAAANPCFDKNVLELLSDVPLYMYVKGGVKRSLFRYSMEGILPLQIQWRTDKQPYVPDGLNRISQSLTETERIFNDNDLIFRYFKQDRVRSLIATQLGKNEAESKYPKYLLSEITLASLTLQWLHKNGYFFNAGCANSTSKR